MASLCFGCGNDLMKPSAALDAELQFCANEVNRLRASINQPALRRSSELEQFATTAIERDATSRTPHAHFTATNGGGVSRAETQILFWRGYTVRKVIELGLAEMWTAGPGGEHYAILAGAFSEVGCGVFERDGEVSVAQEFH